MNVIPRRMQTVAAFVPRAIAALIIIAPQPKRIAEAKAEIYPRIFFILLFSERKRAAYYH